MAKTIRLTMLQAERPPGLSKKRVTEWEALCRLHPTSIIIFLLNDSHLALYEQARYLHKLTGKPLFYAGELEFCSFQPQEVEDILSVATRLGDSILVCGSLTDESRQYFN